jgi:hypothetical protein
MTAREIIEEYALEEAETLACIAHGAEMARERWQPPPHPLLNQGGG